METVLSGIRSTGHLHLGNYFGALRNYIKMQDRILAGANIQSYENRLKFDDVLIKTMEIMKAEDYCGKSMHIGKVVTEAFEKNIEKKTNRDKDRHIHNEKLK